MSHKIELTKVQIDELELDRDILHFCYMRLSHFNRCAVISDINYLSGSISVLLENTVNTIHELVHLLSKKRVSYHRYLNFREKVGSLKTRVDKLNRYQSIIEYRVNSLKHDESVDLKFNWLTGDLNILKLKEHTEREYASFFSKIFESFFYTSSIQLKSLQKNNHAQDCKPIFNFPYEIPKIKLEDYNDTFAPEYGNCLRLSDSQPVKSRALVRQPNDSLNALELIGILGGPIKDCEHNLGHLLDAVNRNSFTKKLFNLLVYTDPSFKITFYDRLNTIGGFDKWDSRLVTLRSNTAISSKVMIHEAMHGFIDLIRRRLFQDPHREMIGMFNNLHLVHSSSDLMLTRLYKIIAQVYKSGVESLTSDDLNLYLTASKVIELEQTSDGNVFYTWFRAGHPFLKSAKEGESYKLSDIDFVSNFVTGSELVFSDKIDAEIKLLTTQIGPADEKVRRTYFFFQCEDRLLTMTVNAFMNKASLVFYNDNEVRFSTVHSRQNEEFVVRVVDTIPLKLIPVLYPGILNQLEYYMDELIRVSEQNRITSLRGVNSDYVYGHRKNLNQINHYVKNGYHLPAYLNAYSIQAAARQVVINQEVSDAPVLIKAIDNALQSKFWINYKLEMQLQLMSSELNYMTGNYAEAEKGYRNIEETDRLFGSSILEAIGLLPASPVLHYRAIVNGDSSINMVHDNAVSIYSPSHFINEQVCFWSVVCHLIGKMLRPATTAPLINNYSRKTMQDDSNSSVCYLRLN